MESGTLVTPTRAGCAAWQKWISGVETALPRLYVLRGANVWRTQFCSHWQTPTSPKLEYVRSTPAIHLPLQFCAEEIQPVLPESGVRSEQKHVTGDSREIQGSRVLLTQTEARMLLAHDFECIQVFHSTGFGTMNIQSCNAHNHFYDTKIVLCEWKVPVWDFDISLQKIWQESWNSDILGFLSLAFPVMTVH